MKRAAILAAALLACNKAPPDPPAALSSSASASASVAASAAAPSLSASASTPVPNALRPPGSAASREEREKAALDLLAGRARAPELPPASVDPGEVFEPRLRAAMGTLMNIEVSVTAEGLDEQEIRKLLDHHRMRFRICYEPGLRRNPNLQGRVVGRVLVKAAGKPELVENAGTELPDGLVVDCALAALRKIDWPAPRAAEGRALVTLKHLPG